MDVPRIWLVLILSFSIICGCTDSLHNKESVQQAVIKRLQTRSGLDLNSMDVTVTSVTFDKKMAYATVSFHPKSETTVNSGLVMKYTLQEQNGQWQVVKVGDSNGGPIMGNGGGHMGNSSSKDNSLPPGHPDVNGAQQPGQALPPGHPQVNSGSAQ